MKKKPTELPIPENFPVRLEAALQLVLSHVKHCDRWRDYRHWVEYCNRTNAGFGNALDQYHEQQQAIVASRRPMPLFSIEEDKDKLLYKADYVLLMSGFLEWRRMSISHKRTEAGSKGGRETVARKQAGPKQVEESRREKARGQKQGKTKSLLTLS